MFEAEIGKEGLMIEIDSLECEVGNKVQSPNNF